MALTLTTPSDYQVFQRNNNDIGTITITGTATANDVLVEARWDGGDWTAIDTTAANAFSGSLTGSPGQGTLEVREDGGAVEDSATFVGIGDIFVIAGQSNASGRGDNNQTYAHATLKAGRFDNIYEWKQLQDKLDSNVGGTQTDVVSSDGGAGGTYWLKMATDYLAEQEIPCAFVPCAKGNSSVTEWLDIGTDTSKLFGSMMNRINEVGGARLVVWHQGETDAANEMGAATYQGHLETMANGLKAQGGPPLMACLLQNSANFPDADEEEIRQGTRDAASANDWITLGPDFSDLTDDGDGVHFTEDATLTTAGARWATAVNNWIKAQESAKTILT